MMNLKAIVPDNMQRSNSVINNTELPDKVSRIRRIMEEEAKKDQIRNANLTQIRGITGNNQNLHNLQIVDEPLPVLCRSQIQLEGNMAKPIKSRILALRAKMTVEETKIAIGELKKSVDRLHKILSKPNLPTNQLEIIAKTLEKKLGLIKIFQGCKAFRL